MPSKELLAKIDKRLTHAMRTAKLSAPSAPELNAIVAAGAGEHQDRLFTMAVKQSIERYLKQVFEGLKDLEAEFDAENASATKFVQ